MRTDDKSKKLTFPIPRSESHKITQLSSQIQWPFSIGKDGLFGLQRAFGSGVGDGTADGVGETGLICTSPSPYFKSQLLKACCHTENYTLSVTSILVSSSILQSENYREREHPLGAVQIFNGQNHRGTNFSDSIWPGGAPFQMQKNDTSL